MGLYNKSGARRFDSRIAQSLFHEDNYIKFNSVNIYLLKISTFQDWTWIYIKYENIEGSEWFYMELNWTTGREKRSAGCATGVKMVKTIRGPCGIPYDPADHFPFTSTRIINSYREDLRIKYFDFAMPLV